MPRAKKSKKLKQLEEKLKILKKEIAKRKKKMQQSTSTPKRKRNRNKTPFEECRTILDRISKCAYSKPFLAPVNWKKLSIPNYPKVIKIPMDISCIYLKLNNHQYITPYEFAADMRLIYQNASTFNKPGTAIFTHASKFCKKFEEEFEKKIIDNHETNLFTKKIAKVVSSLMKREDSSAFRAPVNIEILDIPDYLDVVENPMDLGSVYNQINKYKLFKVFVADLFLVWDNCCKYNPSDNPVHQTALKLRDYTKKQLNRICTNDYQMWVEDMDRMNDEYSPSTLVMEVNNDIKPQTKQQVITTQAPDTSLGSVGYQHQQSLEQQQQHHHHDVGVDDNDVSMMDAGNKVVDNNMVNDIDDDGDNDNDDNNNPIARVFAMCDAANAEHGEHESNKIMINHLLQQDELDSDQHQSLDYYQKEELQRGIQCLDPDHFDPLIEMLQSFIPDGQNDEETDEWELDIDAIDDPLQVKMYNYMLKAIQQQENERIQREGGTIAHIDTIANIQQQNIMDIDNNNTNQINQDNNHNDNDIDMKPAVNNDIDTKQDDNGNNDNNDNDDDDNAADNVITTSFPITSNISSGFPTIPHNMPNVSPPPDNDNNDDNNINLSAFGNRNSNNVNVNDDDDDNNQDIDILIDDNNNDNVADIVMSDNVDNNAHNDNDILTQIENAVETNVNNMDEPINKNDDNQTSLPVLNIDNNNDDTQKQIEPIQSIKDNVNDDNDNDNDDDAATPANLNNDDNNINQQNKDENDIDKQANNENIPQIANLNDPSAENDQNAQNAQNDQIDPNKQSDLNLDLAIIQQNDNKDDNINNNDNNDNDNNNNVIDEEEVDTPLADEIEF